MSRLNKLIGAVVVGASVFVFGGLGSSTVASAAETDALLGYPTYASITSGDDTIYGNPATDFWSLSWGGGNGTYYVDFDDGNGGGYYNPSANFTTYDDTTTYNMGSRTQKTWYQDLYISSTGGGSDQDGAYITQKLR
ncbi:MAG TPA: hypothetical protein VFT51_08430 [Bacillales bacterium]|nr:hypothetical protein [Bacillales bacterium]